jgi:hypothetical protein
MTNSQFWFESFQNWQSEFVALGAMALLSIFLRQRGSPESKPVTLHIAKRVPNNLSAGGKDFEWHCPRFR